MYMFKCKAVIYKSKSYLGLMWEILKHRMYHLIHDGKWMD